LVDKRKLVIRVPVSQSQLFVVSYIDDYNEKMNINVDVDRVLIDSDKQFTYKRLFSHTKIHLTKFTFSLTLDDYCQLTVYS